MPCSPTPAKSVDARHLLHRTERPLRRQFDHLSGALGPDADDRDEFVSRRTIDVDT
jgi:hypothetical protein